MMRPGWPEYHHKYSRKKTSLRNVTIVVTMTAAEIEWAFVYNGLGNRQSPPKGLTGRETGAQSRTSHAEDPAAEEELSPPNQTERKPFIGTACPTPNSWFFCPPEATRNLESRLHRRALHTSESAPLSRDRFAKQWVSLRPPCFRRSSIGGRAEPAIEQEDASYENVHEVALCGCAVDGGAVCRFL